MIRADPKLIEAVSRVSQVARNRGLAWGTPASPLSMQPRIVDGRSACISHCSDSSLLKAAVGKIRSQLRDLGIKYGRHEFDRGE